MTIYTPEDSRGNSVTISINIHRVIKEIYYNNVRVQKQYIRHVQVKCQTQWKLVQLLSASMQRAAPDQWAPPSPHGVTPLNSFD